MFTCTLDLRALLVMSLVGTAIASTGCGDSDSVATGDEADLSQAVIQEGSPEALGVLRLVNTATVKLLDVDAALTSTAAKSIVKHRVGADGVEGTQDDDAYGTIAEIAAVKYVGTATLKQLLAYAKAHAYVETDDPMDDASCQGEALTAAELLVEVMPSGATHRTLDGFRLVTRQRACNDVTGCAAWPGAWTQQGTAKLAVTSGPVGPTGDPGPGRLDLELSDPVCVINHTDGAHVGTCGWKGDSVDCRFQSIGTNCHFADEVTVVKGLSTDHCIRVKGTASFPTKGGHDEVETYALLKY